MEDILVSDWTPAAYKAREDRRRLMERDRLAERPVESQDILRSDWTLTAYEAREAERRRRERNDIATPTIAQNMPSSESTLASRTKREEEKRATEAPGNMAANTPELSETGLSDWTLPAYAAREKERRRCDQNASAPQPAAESTPESEWTLTAFKRRQEQMRLIEASGSETTKPPPALEMLLSEWALPAYAAREAERRAREGIETDTFPSSATDATPNDAAPDSAPTAALSPAVHMDVELTPIFVSDWTLPAFKLREENRRRSEPTPDDNAVDARHEPASSPDNEDIIETVTAEVAPQVLASAHHTPEITVGDRPQKNEAPASALFPVRTGFTLRRLVYSAGAVVALALAVFLMRLPFRSAPPAAPAKKIDAARRTAPPTARANKEATPPATSGTNASSATSAPPPAPKPAEPTGELAPKPAQSLQTQAPVKEQPDHGLPETTAIPSTAPTNPPAPSPPPAAQPDSAKKEPGAPALQEPAASSEATRPKHIENKPTAPKRAAESKPKPVRSEARPAAGWFDQVVNSIKRLGHKLTH